MLPHEELTRIEEEAHKWIREKLWHLSSAMQHAMKNARIEGAIAELSAALEREKELKKTDNLSGETSNVFQYSIDMDKVILAKDKEIESLRERLEKAETRIKKTGSGINKMWS